MSTLSGDRTGSDVRLDELSGLTPLARTTLTHDPEPVYEQLRSQWGPVPPVELVTGVNSWLVLDYADAMHVFRDQLTFSRDVVNWPPFHDGRVPPGSALHAFLEPRESAYFVDGAEQARLRAIVDDAFDVIDERAFAAQLRTACDRMLDRIAEDGTADLVSAYTQFIPSQAVATMFGLDPELASRLVNHVSDAFSNDAGRTMSGVMGVMTVLSEQTAVRRTHPTDDALSTIVHHPNARTPTEAVHAAALVQVAGHELAVGWLTTSLVQLLSDAGFGARVRSGRLGIDEAIDTVMTQKSPMWNATCRFVTADVDLGGRRLHKGEAVVVAIAEATASAHRGADPIWSGTSRAHLGFGAGVHRCPADRFSRIITKTGVEQALIRLPGLRLAVPADELEFGTSLWSRSAARLPVTFVPTINPDQ
ncbi:hypothetical protein [Promicromonospora sp. NFX87]|uniref:hypothetical protein n=1 Tax=Promicromonospora sp. NFX87 TaxID=3402691 RepID=UPI003AFAB171